MSGTDAYHLLSLLCNHCTSLRNVCRERHRVSTSCFPPLSRSYFLWMQGLSFTFEQLTARRLFSPNSVFVIVIGFFWLKWAGYLAVAGLNLLAQILSDRIIPDNVLNCVHWHMLSLPRRFRPATARYSAHFSHKIIKMATEVLGKNYSFHCA